MSNPEHRPMLVHCTSANRVGALLIPYLVLDKGNTPEEAVEMAPEVILKSDELKQVALRYAGVNRSTNRSHAACRKHKQRSGEERRMPRNSTF